MKLQKLCRSGGFRGHSVLGAGADAQQAGLRRCERVPSVVARNGRSYGTVLAVGLDYGIVSCAILDNLTDREASCSVDILINVMFKVHVGFS